MISLSARLSSVRGIRSHVARPSRASTTVRAEPEPASDQPKKPEEKKPEVADTVEPIVEAKAETIEVKEVTPEPVAAPTPKIDVEDDGYILKVEGNRFQVPSGSIGSIAAASPGLGLRAGMAVFVAGYSASFIDQDFSQYTLQAVSGKQLKEESTLIPTFNRPEKPVVIYEFDSCPFCKKVREMVNYLDLDILFYPCPKDGPNFRPEAIKKGGKSMFPYMEDPNTGTSMYESDDIIKYLADTYGDGTVPSQLKLGPVTAIACGLSGIGRIGKGGKYSPSTLPKEPLILWGYEPSPFTRVVRERIVELEIPHLFKTVCRGSSKRQEMFEKYGKFQAPLLEDPNTLTALFESDEIIKYLDENYSTPGAPSTPAPEPAETTV